jgi:hypothetical protein
MKLQSEQYYRKEIRKARRMVRLALLLRKKPQAKHRGRTMQWWALRLVQMQSEYKRVQNGKNGSERSTSGTNG